jgi:HD-GYP domain-containing protein (c-di-GMP phosphodiesterase class II)
LLDLTYAFLQAFALIVKNTNRIDAMASLTVKLRSDSWSGKFSQVPVSALRVSNFPSVDIFCKNAHQPIPQLLCSKTLNSQADALANLEDRGHQFLYVRKSDFKQVSHALYNSLEEIVNDQTVPCTQRYSILQTAVAVEVEVAFRRTDCNRLMNLATKIGTQIAKLLTDSPVVLHELFDIAQHDVCTFTHITNVAAYAVVLAQQLGIKDIQELNKIAAGAMLHDVGKRFIPQGVLTKPGKLTLAEKKIIESHPTLGYRELCMRKKLEWSQLMMVYQHHEWVDGTGYPVGILEEEIHPWAQLLAVVDVFDAMTAIRPYREPISSSDALLYISENAKTQFSPEAVLCWISAFLQS